jgi:hypothetical protein
VGAQGGPPGRKGAQLAGSRGEGRALLDEPGHLEQQLHVKDGCRLVLKIWPNEAQVSRHCQNYPHLALKLDRMTERDGAENRSGFE